jgi:glycyl-tRNA synthetase beta chain
VSAPAQAVNGFAKKNGVSVDALKKTQGSKGEVYVARVRTAGVSLAEVLAGKVEAALKSLPIPKMMRWGAGEAQFVRPVHGVVMLHGKKVVPGSVLGLPSAGKTRGHRFMGGGEIILPGAEEYQATLAKHHVVAGFEERKEAIDGLLKKTAAEQKGALGEYRDLLDEVTALVEEPSVYVGSFDASFLSVPQECLILTMRQNQKYFPLFDAQGKLLPKFLIVSNMKVADPKHIIGGNQRVVRPRLEDARFFYDQDRKIRLEARVPRLASVVFHRKLGSQLERVERLQLLAGHIARQIGAPQDLAERAAWLSKADLLTGMVGEFPELQGLMGGYYARHDREPKEVCAAIADQYRLRLDDMALAENLPSVCLYLADRIDLLLGLFGVGEIPTGDKDPFGLRRAALGVIGVFDQLGTVAALTKVPIPDIGSFLDFGKSLFPKERLSANVVQKVHDFILERYWNHLALYPTTSIEAVLSQRPKLSEIVSRVQAVEAFRALPEAESLAAANKRVANILKQAEAKGEAFENVSFGELVDPAERALHEAIRKVSDKAKPLYESGDYTGYLKSFAVLKAPVDTFFDKVMVMVEDEKLRRGRLALLRDLREAMNRVADLSKLAA